MSVQTELVFAPDAVIKPSVGTGTMRERFESYDRENPEVFAALRYLALQAVHSGQKRIGIASLFEVVRWKWNLATRDGNGFRCNNSYRSFFARKLADSEPELRGVFEMRALISERAA